MPFLLSASQETGEPLFRAMPTGKVLPRGEHAALVDAHGLIRHARAQAADILEQARAAYQAERARGYADGLAAAKAEQADAMLRISQQTSAHLKQVEGQLVELVVASLRRIVSDFDAADRALAAVRGGLALVRQQKHVLLCVHPDDADTIRQHLQDLLATFPGVDYVDVAPDGRLQRGACRIETAIGTVDSSLERQVEALRRAFEQALASSADPGHDAGDAGV